MEDQAELIITNDLKKSGCLIRLPVPMIKSS